MVDIESIRHRAQAPVPGVAPCYGAATHNGKRIEGPVRNSRNGSHAASIFGRQAEWLPFIESTREKHAMKSPPFRKSILAFTLAIMSALFATHSSAQVVVHDVDNDEVNFPKTVVQYGKELDHYKSVIEHYQQQLISLQHMNFSLPQLETAYTRVSEGDASQQAQDQCPGTTGNSNPIASLLQLVTPDLGKSLLAEQQKFCQQIVLHRINKYNLTVDMMNRLNGTYTQNLQSIYNQYVDGGTSQGAMDGSKANAEANTTALQTEMTQWQNQIRAEDQVIAYDQYQIQVLSKKALDGNNTILGNVVQMAALKGALETVGN
jgi:hypothetical protein